ncbi:MAG: cation:proton antiporter [Bacteroidales bacterium]|nr:cation:proton antiporter [Bacteroidales bacterium]
MAEELNLVADLALILIAAGIFTVISKALKQPLILGYIVAGFLIGPHMSMFPGISGMESVEQWSEIGIIFLLFALGLEFSFKKLLKVGSSALITAGTNCIGMFTVGVITGNALGWSMMESIFLGGLLSMSSTTIIIKAYDEMGLKKKPYAGLIFGILVVEDLIAVLLMVLLSTLAVSSKFSGTEMLLSLARLAFFLILWFLVGIYAIPLLLKKARKYLNDEILLILSIGLCFGMVALASFAGFSSALGAFVMGSILAETIEGERISHLLKGIKDMFGAIFFVSVGMLVDPSAIIHNWGTVLVLTIVAMGGILLFSSAGALLAGKGVDTALHVGFSLSQLGEFSFIIASLGCSLGVMRDFIYPVIISVSVITTFTTPYMIKAADPVSAWLQRVLPSRILDRINPPQNDYGKVSKAESNEWVMLLKSYALRIILYGVILLAILLAAPSLLGGLVARLFPSLSTEAGRALCLATELAAMVPFLYGMVINNGNIRPMAAKLLKEKSSNRWPILSLLVLRILIAIAFTIAAITGYFHLGGWGILMVVAAGFAVFITAKISLKRFSGLERRFMENFNEKEEHERKKAPVASSVREKMSRFDIHTSMVEISPDFSYIGKPLRDMPFREHSGANIIKILRGSTGILIPSGDEPVYPGDKLVAVGTNEQLDAFKATIDANTPHPPKDEDGDFIVQAGQLGADSFLCGKKLSETDMRRSGCMVISVLHDGRLITNPGADFTFREGDTVWIAGESGSCEWFLG